MLCSIYYAFARISWCKSQDQKIFDLPDFNMLACVTCTSQDKRTLINTSQKKKNMILCPNYRVLPYNQRCCVPFIMHSPEFHGVRVKTKRYLTCPTSTCWLVSRAQANLPGKTACGEIYAGVSLTIHHLPGTNNRTSGPCENLVCSTGMAKKKGGVVVQPLTLPVQWLVSRAQANLPSKTACGKYRLACCSPSTTYLPEPLVFVGT